MANAAVQNFNLHVLRAQRPPRHREGPQRCPLAESRISLRGECLWFRTIFHHPWSSCLTHLRFSLCSGRPSGRFFSSRFLPFFVFCLFVIPTGEPRRLRLGGIAATSSHEENLLTVVSRPAPPAIPGHLSCPKNGTIVPNLPRLDTPSMFSTHSRSCSFVVQSPFFLKGIPLAGRSAPYDRMFTKSPQNSASSCLLPANSPLKLSRAQ